MSGMLVKALRDQRRAVVGWGIGMAATAMMYAAFYPSVKKSAADLDKYIQNMPEAIRNLIGGDYTTPAGYLHTELFSFLGPVLFLVFAIGAGARAIAGEEEGRTLDLLLSTPLLRPHVLRDKLVAMVASTAILAGVVWLVVMVGGRPFDLVVSGSAAAGACAMLFLVGLAFGTIALAAGCATGHKAVANGIAGGLAVFTYVLNALATSVDALRWIRPFSPFRWYLEPDPLQSGIRAVNVAVLLAIAVVAYAVAEVTFRRRDLAA